ncbi:MAG: thioredoxin family protein [Flavobacteriales bacterium]|nr:thioredoxin family protein [Flavobacteriales bacterium]
MNRRYPIVILLFLLISFSGFVYGQDDDKTPKKVTWTISFNKSSAKVGEEVELILKGKIAPHQHMYANDFECDPIPYELKLKSGSFKAVGTPKSFGFKKYKDDIFGCDVKDFEDKAEIRQKLKVLNADFDLSGSIDYQTCTDYMCLSFKDDLKIPTLKLEKSTTEPSVIVPEEVDTASNGNGADTPQVAQPKDIAVDTQTVNKENTSEITTEHQDLENKGLWGLFILGIGGGLLALLTPCVFPMIPMTVAYFTKQKDKAKGRKMAIFYGLSILLISLVLGMALAALFGEAFTNQLSTHWLPNIIFFLIFMVFAASFLGMFEIVLPNSFVNKMDQQGDRGGYIGIFFIAFTLVLVSFSCTVPIVGSVAILASKGEFIRPLFAMLGFGLMFALPFTLFAFFPQWLSSLPKSGGWLNSVKVVLGIIEIALALKFLSQADVVYHWRILDRDVFIAIWISLSIMLGLYLLGKIKFSHDSDIPHVSVPRFAFAFMAFAFAFYLLPGMWGAPLRHLSGVLPPMGTQDYVVLNGGIANSAPEETEQARFSDILHLPHGLKGYFYYREGLEAAKKQNKPIFVDFTGHACANCRRMEEYVWVKPEILNRLKNDFVILSLYVDERTELPEKDWVKKDDGTLLKGLGEQNFNLQVVKYKSAGQPYYYIINSDEKVLSVFNGYDPDVSKFASFLDEGKQKFKAN